MKTQDPILHELLDIGEQMLISGAEVNRVEDTLNRMGMAYGASNMNVFVITSSIIITMTMPNGSELTQSRRILSSGSTDFTKFEQLNDLSRQYCLNPTTTSSLQTNMEQICTRRPAKLRYCLGSMLAAGSFAVFFGGSFMDGIAGAAVAIFLCIFQDTIAYYCRNKIIFNLFTAFWVGIIICLMPKMFPFLHMEEIMIGTIMLLIPGIAMTNSIRDILMGDTISGIMRLIETLFWAGALACGFMAAIWFLR